MSSPQAVITVKNWIGVLNAASRGNDHMAKARYGANSETPCS